MISTISDSQRPPRAPSVILSMLKARLIREEEEKRQNIEEAAFPFWDMIGGFAAVERDAITDNDLRRSRYDHLDKRTDKGNPYAHLEVYEVGG